MTAVEIGESLNDAISIIRYRRERLLGEYIIQSEISTDPEAKSQLISNQPSNNQGN